jgi:hypothetical protein
MVILQHRRVKLQGSHTLGASKINTPFGLKCPRFAIYDMCDKEILLDNCKIEQSGIGQPPYKGLLDCPEKQFPP